MWVILVSTNLTMSLGRTDSLASATTPSSFSPVVYVLQLCGTDIVPQHIRLTPPWLHVLLNACLLREYLPIFRDQTQGDAVKPHLGISLLLWTMCTCLRVELLGHKVGFFFFLSFRRYWKYLCFSCFTSPPTFGVKVFAILVGDGISSWYDFAFPRWLMMYLLIWISSLVKCLFFTYILDSILFSDVNTIIHLLRLVLCYVLNYCYLSSSYFKSQGGGPNRKKLRTLRAAIYEREK